ncbi:unnamed protein product [Microthlaspi erraticum]|uniref:Arabidopsis retrotransposon Orf1 C-terminal domain-containing protein n=2 Tax=Microthlaspi erraticum TaxID=1685480 RepID=A0A6D2KLN7_9BRAS|nr:unnamed protein product [Microthlaspi erraticum]
MVSTTRGTLSRAAAEKAEGKKPVTEEGSGSRKSGSAVMKSKDYAEIFDQMSFVGTRYPDLTAMAELGISQDCHYLFEEMQLARLMMNPLPAYKKETIEFLSTLRVNFYEPDEIMPEGHGSGRFSFRINKRKYRMSFKELEDVFHFEHKDGRETEPGTPQAELQAFWAMIGVGEYMSSTAKSTHIRNPVLRYVHKSLAHTIYARRDVTGVTEKELFFLNEGMKKVIHTLPDGTEMVGDRSGNSVPTYLLKSFLSYREYALSLNKVHKASSGQLSCGGLIMPILMNYGITLEKPVDPQAINIHYLRKSTY